jgi:hypothetical protein
LYEAIACLFIQMQSLAGSGGSVGVTVVVVSRLARAVLRAVAVAVAEKQQSINDGGQRQQHQCLEWQWRLKWSGGVSGGGKEDGKGGVKGGGSVSGRQTVLTNNGGQRQ